MKKETIRELKDLINKAYKMGNDSRISLYLKIMYILDYYDENTTIEDKFGEGNVKIIDILNDIANRKEVPLKIKWRDKIWEYYIRNQDYYASNGEALFENMTMIRTLDFITDEVEIIED